MRHFQNFFLKNSASRLGTSPKNTLFDVSFVSIRFNVSRFSDEPGFEKKSIGEIIDHFMRMKLKNVDRRKLIDVGVYFFLRKMREK